jgi:hypothetical protein
MRKLILVASAAVILQVTSPASAAVGVNVNIGLQQPVVITHAPEFIYAPTLGFYVAVGIPYDVMRVSNSYYLHRGNVWYRAPYYNGPWVATRYKNLPPGLRKHKFERIRSVRDREYRAYQSNRNHYQGKRFRPVKEWKHESRHERRIEKEDRNHGNGKHRGGNHGRN